jgi:glycosyltransferase involved in cell wall biosynthesis
MDSRPSVSFVVTFYNHGQYIGENLDLIFSQTWPCDECILVDDASTDGSERILQEYQKRYPKLKVFRNEKNVGNCKTTNRAMSEAKGDWIAPMASDDLRFPEFIESCMTAVMQHPEIGYCFCDYSTFEDREPRQYKRVNLYPSDQPQLFRPQQIEKLSRQTDFKLSSFAAIFRRDLIQKYGFFNVNLKSLADHYQCYQIALRHPVYYIPKPLGAFRIVPRSYGSRVRFNYRERMTIIDTLTSLIWKTEDPAFRKSFQKAGCLEQFGGYFLLLYLALRPWRWHRFLSMAPKVFRLKIRKWRNHC